MKSIREVAELIARHHLDSERVSVTQFCDIQAAIEQAIRDERQRCRKIAESWEHRSDVRLIRKR